MNEIIIKDLDKADVLVALYSAASPQGMGFLSNHTLEVTKERATELLKETSYFDYLNGRVMKVDLSGDTLRTGLFDRDNGDGAALAALQRAGLLPAVP